jgi:hypothetical protein
MPRFPREPASGPARVSGRSASPDEKKKYREPFRWVLAHDGVKGRCPSPTRIGRGLDWRRPNAKQKKTTLRKTKRNMKTIKTLLSLPMAALLLTTVFAGLAAADKQTPLKGSLQGVEIADVQFPKLFVDGSGSGKATHLGRFTMTYELEVDLLTSQTFGSSVFTAANGDSLATDITGLGTPTANADVVSVEEAHTITGGTGRFAGATGSFVRTYLLNLVTGVTSGSFDGIIVLDHGHH